VLIQDKQEVMRCGVDEPALQKLLELFFGYEPEVIVDFCKAVEQFKTDLPAVLTDLREMIEAAERDNDKFRKASLRRGRPPRPSPPNNRAGRATHRAARRRHKRVLLQRREFELRNENEVARLTPVLEQRPERLADDRLARLARDAAQVRKPFRYCWIRRWLIGL
jgi:hypothetical protein